MRHKYHATPTVAAGIKFSSKLEARYYEQLLLRKRVGEVVVFLRQTPFHLPGGVRYVCDFTEFWADGSVHFVDTKGYVTPAFRDKKKMVEEVYAPIEIEVVKRI
jgi:dissimilatory sulfite reductase (desulfoviridin) alpha/beta subunit